MIKNKLILSKGECNVNEPQKNYYAIIPASVRYDENIRPNAKLLYGEITALCNEKGYCWASNQYFAELYKVSKTSISLWIKDLINNGYVTTELVYKEGSKEILHRYLRIVNDHTQQKLNTPTQQKLKDNNTVINNTINNTTQKEQFEKIWIHYPLKKGKENAFKAYQKALKEGTQDKDILNGIQRYKKEIQKRGTKKEYIAYASTWFNQKRWLDEYDGFENNTTDVAKNKKKATKVNWTDIYG